MVYDPGEGSEKVCEFPGLVKIIIFHEDELGIKYIAQSRRPSGRLGWVQGKIRPGEKDSDAAVRNIHEDVGLNVCATDLQFLGKKDVVFNGQPGRIVFFSTISGF